MSQRETNKLVDRQRTLHETSGEDVLHGGVHILSKCLLQENW